MHFLYGPNSRQFVSFADFIKFQLKQNHLKPEEVDEKMREYVSTKLGWFKKLRDLRDYESHIKSLDISLFENEDESISIYLQNEYELANLVSEIYGGLQLFIGFYDYHFTGRVMMTNINDSN